MNDRAGALNRVRFTAPALPDDASTDDIALWLADTRTKAHQLIDESVTAAQDVLSQRAAVIDGGDPTAQAQRHAQRLAIERLRRAVADLTLEVHGVHGRLDRMEGLLRQVAGLPAVTRDAADVADALVSACAATAVLNELQETSHTTFPTDEADATDELAPHSTGVDEQGTDRAPSTPEFALISDARAAVEAAVASALQDARRAASEGGPRTDARPRPTPVVPNTATPRPAAVERPLAWQTRPTAPLAEPVAGDSPRAFLDASADVEAAVSTPEPAETEMQPPTLPAAPVASAASNHARPGLWVPPSAVVPARAVPAPTPGPEEERPVTQASAETPAEPVMAPEPAMAMAAAPSVAAAPVFSAPASAAAARADVATQPAPGSMPHGSGTFYPDGGPVILRIAPISGFQGLMRVQDSVVQLGAVREATVEAYARGEARLRLQLVGALESDALSDSLTASLGTRADLQSISDEERSIQISLG
ncbi:MAG: hypothetical protein EXR66_03995 [Dehalococcoidia bacterium]|nr:hypothetical protein [Dehalococcoidia bacterium]